MSIFVAYICWPAYRRKIDAQAGWYSMRRAIRYLAHQRDLESREAAIRLLHQKMCDLVPLVGKDSPIVTHFWVPILNEPARLPEKTVAGEMEAPAAPFNGATVGMVPRSE